jgi:CHRD domain-containing protein
MRRVRPSAVVSLVLSMTLVLVAGTLVPAAHAKGRPGGASSLLLLPSNVVPGPGDLAASGSFTWSAGRDAFNVRVTLNIVSTQVQRIVIKRGVEGVYGTQVLQCSPNHLGISELNGFVPANGELLREMKRNPRGFYMEVSTVSCPSGALRGQLSQ